MNIRTAIAAVLLLATTLPAFADTAAPTPPPPPRRGLGGFGGGPFPQQGGEAIYKGVCQGCHMPDAKGAVGAGMYPALAKNENLETAGYPVGVIVKGQKAMPALGTFFSDRRSPMWSITSAPISATSTRTRSSRKTSSSCAERSGKNAKGGPRAAFFISASFPSA